MARSKRGGRVRLDTDSARAGATLGVMRYVLGISLALVIIGFLAVYFLH